MSAPSPLSTHPPTPHTSRALSVHFQNLRLILLLNCAKVAEAHLFHSDIVSIKTTLLIYDIILFILFKATSQLMHQICNSSEAKGPFITQRKLCS